MKDRRQVWLVAAFVVLFAVTRWPGLLPLNFSAAYALMFCAGVFFRGPSGWWMPLVLIAATDLLLDFYYLAKGYNPFNMEMAFNYVAYVALIWLGRKFDPRRSIGLLVGGALVGAIVFYVVTNTASWLFNPFHNPEYTKTLAGWLIALTKGTGNWPQTWEFFRNTLLSAGLFTALFAAAYKYSAHLESAAEKKAAEATAEGEETAAETPESEESPA